MTPPASGEAPAAPGRILAALVVAPPLLHAAALVLDAARRDLTFRTGDAVLALGVVLYALLAGRALRDAARARRLVFGLVTLLIVLGAVEGMLRVVVPAPQARLPWPPMRLRAAVGDQMPGISGEYTVTVGPLGVRGPPDVRLEDAAVRILCVGGSSTECLYVTDERTWPWRLGDELTRRLEKRVLVGNAGRSGHFTLHHEHQIRNYRHTKEFPWVVVMPGINDLGALARESYADRVARVPEEALTTAAQRVPYYRKMRIALVMERIAARVSGSGSSVVQDLRGDWYAEVRAQRRKALATTPLAAPPAALPEQLATYRTNLRAIAAACRSNGQRLVLVTQPTLYAEGLPPEAEALLWQHDGLTAFTTPTLARMMEAFNAEVREVGRSEGIPVIDLAAALPRETRYFYDDCHFTIAGCEAVAGIVADRLEALIREAGPEPTPSVSPPARTSAKPS